MIAPNQKYLPFPEEPYERKKNQENVDKKDPTHISHPLSVGLRGLLLKNLVNITEGEPYTALHELRDNAHMAIAEVFAELDALEHENPKIYPHEKVEHAKVWLEQHWNDEDSK